MKLSKGKKYSNNRSDIYININKIYFEHEDYYKIKGTLVNKRNAIVYETKGYKLYKHKICDWREYA